MEGAQEEQLHIEELRILRERVQQMERELAAQGREAHIDTLISHQADAYVETAPVSSSAVVIESAPDNNDAVIAEFTQLMKENGIPSAIAAIEKLNDAHLSDDVHRFLVQYIKEGYEPYGLKERSLLLENLRYTLLSVQFPKREKREGEVEVPTSHEEVRQFMQSLSSLSRTTKKSIAIELASPVGSESVVSYVAVPDEVVELVSQQLRAAFLGVRLVEMPDDYNVFVEGGEFVMGRAELAESMALPLVVAGDQVRDALRGMYVALAEVGKERGGAIQFVIQPENTTLGGYASRVLGALQKGSSRSEALAVPRTQLGVVARDFGKALFYKNKEENDAKKEKVNDEPTMKLVSEKLATPAYRVVLRVVTSSGTSHDAEALHNRITTPFSQFARADANRLEFKKIYNSEHDFTYRVFTKSQAQDLTVGELAVMVPFGSRSDTDLPSVEQVKSTEVPSPLNLPTSGVLLGHNIFRGNSRPIFLSAQDRLRHLYVIGQTGAGKSNFLKSLIVQDMQAGNGVCFIDPHGTDVVDLLAQVPPERFGDVVYFDPAYTERSYGLNMLEYDPARPEQKTFVVNELFSIFKKLYSGTPESMGPAFEQYFRNATMLVMEDPESGSTMIDISRVLSDKAFRDLKLSRSKNMIVNRFWTDIATKAGGDASLENIVPYITNKFDDFIANDLMRPIIGQQYSTIRFRELMDQKKIFLVNLSKGRLGERNAHLLGLILVGKIFMAALSRADSREQLPPFYLYIDEFHNITTDSISQILSEARKYGLGMVLAHQYMAQISEDIHDAVFGNVGSLVAFRVGADDATDLEHIFGDVFSIQDLQNIENYRAHLRILANGVPQSPFTLAAQAMGPGNEAQIDDLRTLSYLTYAKDRARVDERIMQRLSMR